MRLSDFDPRKQPQNVRQTMLVILAGAFIWCLAANMGSSFLELVFHDLPIHLGLGLIACGFYLVFSVLFSKRSHRDANEQIASLFETAGFCDEIAEQLRGPAAIDERAKVLRAFILVMSEQYEEAKDQMADIMTQALTQREYAMLLTAKLRLYFMTMHFDKAEHILANAQEKLDAAYAERPDFSADYYSYEDDAFEYDMLMAAYCDMTQQSERAELYRQQAKERALSRRQAENMILPKILELNRLYSTGEQDSAGAQENELLMLAKNLSVSQGRKHELRRYIEQAKIFYTLRAFAKPARSNERPLPPERQA